MSKYPKKMGLLREGSHSGGGLRGSLGGLPSTKPGGWSVSGAGAGAASSSKIPLATEPPESCVSGDCGPLAAVKSSSLIEAAVEWAVEVTEGERYSLIFWFKDCDESCVQGTSPWYGATASDDPGSAFNVASLLEKGVGSAADGARSLLQRCNTHI